MKDEVYFYRNGPTWTPFFCSPEDGKKWVNFCRRLGRKNPKDPNPYHEDYREFLDTLPNKEAAN
ncbi:MAG: hypothetical protein ABIN67_13865 [Ferruginibacter sp.]